MCSKHPRVCCKSCCCEQLWLCQGPWSRARAVGWGAALLQAKGILGWSHWPVSLWSCSVFSRWFSEVLHTAQLMDKFTEQKVEKSDLVTQYWTTSLNWGQYRFKSKVSSVKNKLEYFQWGEFPCKTQITSTCLVTHNWRSVCDKYMIVPLQVLACCECSLKCWSKTVINVVYYVTPPIKHEKFVCAGCCIIHFCIMHCPSSCIVHWFFPTASCWFSPVSKWFSLLQQVWSHHIYPVRASHLWLPSGKDALRHPQVDVPTSS